MLLLNNLKDSLISSCFWKSVGHKQSWKTKSLNNRRNAGIYFEYSFKSINARTSFGYICYLSKAFNLINCEVFSNKVERCGARWISSSSLVELTFYEMGTFCGNAKSPIRTHTAYSKLGVPQGSILSALLFLVYIDDIDWDLPDSYFMRMIESCCLGYLQQRVSDSLLSLQN